MGNNAFVKAFRVQGRSYSLWIITLTRINFTVGPTINEVDVRLAAISLRIRNVAIQCLSGSNCYFNWPIEVIFFTSQVSRSSFPTIKPWMSPLSVWSLDSFTTKDSLRQRVLPLTMIPYPNQLQDDRTYCLNSLSNQFWVIEIEIEIEMIDRSLFEWTKWSFRSPPLIEIEIGR